MFPRDQFRRWCLQLFRRYVVRGLSRPRRRRPRVNSYFAETLESRALLSRTSFTDLIISGAVDVGPTAADVRTARATSASGSVATAVSTGAAAPAARPSGAGQTERLSSDRVTATLMVAETEPNDSAAQAQRLTFSSTYRSTVLTGSLARATDVDFTSIQVSQSGRLSLQLKGDAASTGLVTVLSSDGRELASSLTARDGVIQVQVTAGQSVLVRVSNGSSSSTTSTSTTTATTAAATASGPATPGSEPSAAEIPAIRQRERNNLPQVTEVETWTTITSTGTRSNFAPSIVKLHEGGYRIYWNDYPNNGISSAISTDGIHFTAEPGLRMNNADGGDLDGVASHAWVIAVDGGYRMYYQGDANAVLGDNGTPHEFRIFSAFSTDGLNFTREGVRIDIGDSTGLSQAAHGRVIRLADGTYRMYFSANFANTNGPTAILGATSTDGLSWTLDAAPIISGAHDPTVTQVGNKIVMYTSYGGQNLLHLESTDGYHFTPVAWVDPFDASGTALDGVGDVDILYVDGRLLMYGTSRGTSVLILEQTASTTPPAVATNYELHLRFEPVNPVQGPDERESNNTREEATRIEFPVTTGTGTPMQRRRELQGIAGGPTQDRDFFRVRIQAGDELTVGMQTLGGAAANSLAIAVTDASGRVLGRGTTGQTGGSTATVRATTAGDYFISVVPQGTSGNTKPVAYKLSVAARSSGQQSTATTPASQGQPTGSTGVGGSNATGVTGATSTSTSSTPSSPPASGAAASAPVGATSSTRRAAASSATTSAVPPVVGGLSSIPIGITNRLGGLAAP